MKIELLPGAKLSPQTLLAQMLGDADKMAGVVVIPIWNNAEGERDTLSAHWSNMSLRDLCFALKFFHYQVDREITDAAELADAAEVAG